MLAKFKLWNRCIKVEKLHARQRKDLDGTGKMGKRQDILFGIFLNVLEFNCCLTKHVHVVLCIDTLLSSGMSKGCKVAHGKALEPLWECVPHLHQDFWDLPSSS